MSPLPADKKQKRLGEILIEKGLLTQPQLEAALERQKRTKEFLGAILLKENLIKERYLLEALSEQCGVPVISLKNRYIDWKFVKQFTPELILGYKCFPVGKDDWAVTVAVTNPLDVWPIKKAEEEARGLKLKLVLVSEEDMREAIERYREFMRGDISKAFE